MLHEIDFIGSHKLSHSNHPIPRDSSGETLIILSRFSVLSYYGMALHEAEYLFCHTLNDVSIRNCEDIKSRTELFDQTVHYSEFV